MRSVICLAIVLLAPATDACPAETLDRLPEMNVLGRWVGTWNVTAVVSPTEWFPQGGEMKETKTAEWILGDRFVQESVQGEGYKARVLYGYDEKKRVFRAWYFSSDGSTTEWAGDWNEESSTMTWVSDRDDLKWMGTVHFLSPDSYELVFVVKKTSGEVLMEFKTQHKRIEGQIKGVRTL